MSNQTSVDLSRLKASHTEINEKLFKKLNKSVVFADTQFLEWFNLTCGVAKLFKNGGVQNVKKFNSFQVLIPS